MLAAWQFCASFDPMTVQSEFWKDRLNTPAYRVGEAASYARISPTTVAHWEKGRPDGKRAAAERQKSEGLSFLQLIEIAVVARLRAKGVKLDRIRTARDYFSEVLGSKHPFALEKFKTDGVNILVDFESADGAVLQDRLIAFDERGQLVWTEMLKESLDEFNYSDGTAVQWMVGGPDSRVIIDPRICFGSPSVDGVMTRALKNEWATGQTISEISEDFDLPDKAILDALRFEGINI